ncbi:ImmA/IrrE family metallo-endopeptidase [Metabacillus sp. RGM 3146]|uniref:ImmA/IrrE family metallo-endopeptidase n=1 Tax=Metabacillus sp. RGM 3146 TaxID=3401092 RepID=UPI003B9B288A
MKGCVTFDLKGIFTSEKRRIDARSISSDYVFINPTIDVLFQTAKKMAGHKTGIYVLYLSGDYLAPGKGKKVVGVGGTELVSFQSAADYELSGRILLTEKAAGRYTLAHELGHVLFSRYEPGRAALTHDDPSGPYIHSTGKRSPAHNNDQNNLMYPVSPSAHPRITRKQCQTARQSKITRRQKGI